MSLLTVCNNAFARQGLATKSAFVGSTDKAAIEMLALAQQEGRELSRRGAWKILTRETTFSTVAQAAQTDSGALPSDLDWIIPETMFNRTMFRQVEGPLSPVEWQQLQAGFVNRVWPAYRIRGTSLLLAPTPPAGQTIGYEYITTSWCQSAGDVEQSAWAADTDSALLDEELHTLGLVLRFRKANGLDFSADTEEYDWQVRMALQREGTKPRLNSDQYGTRMGADALAAARGNVLISTDGDGISWD